jgi:hypothetical protein
VCNPLLEDAADLLLLFDERSATTRLPLVHIGSSEYGP